MASMFTDIFWFVVNGDRLSVGLASVFTGLLLIRYKLKDGEKQGKLLPPGPPTLPVIGNLHQMLLLCQASLINFLEKYRKIYGNVYTVELGGTKSVVISGYETIVDLLERKADFTSNRTLNILTDDSSKLHRRAPGLFWSPYPHWKIIRRFALTQLRDGGMGRSSLETSVVEELDTYLRYYIYPHRGRPVDISESLMHATANIISVMVMGRRFEYSDPTLSNYVDGFEKFNHTRLRSALTKNLPLSRYLPDVITGRKTSQKAYDTVLPLSRRWVKEHKMEGSKTNNFIGRMLSWTTENGNSSKYPSDIFSEDNIAMTTIQLYLAGTETTAAAFMWTLLFLCLNQDVQERAYREIHHTIGDRVVTYSDRHSLPYLESVMYESLRMANIAPVALPHVLDRDTVIDGQHIPAGSDLLLNMTSILFDEQIFEDPYSFRPERYMCGDRRLKISHTTVFGLGRRSCLGRDLARMELFIFLATFVQKFSMKLPLDDVPSMKGIFALLNAPRPFKLIFCER